MTYAYLGLGSNVGERETQLDEAVRILNNKNGIEVTKVSPIYETEPVGYVDQPQFLNQVLPGSSAVLQPLIPLLDDNNPAELLRPSHILSQDIASRDGLIPHAQQPQNVPQRRTDMDFFVGRKGKSLKMKTIIFMF